MVPTFQKFVEDHNEADMNDQVRPKVSKFLQRDLKEWFGKIRGSSIALYVNEMRSSYE